MSKKRYQKKDPIEHILLRPDMYVGSTRLRVINEYIAERKNDDGNFSISLQEIKTSPAILRIFVEALSNAIDNVERSLHTKTKCTKIKVSIDRQTGETSIWNDGDIVPVEINEDENCYNHSMIFGQLLTGSNYDDEEERVVSGRNGLGVKLTNVFSKKFSVIGCDPNNGKILEQEWTNNMKETQGPKIKSTKLKNGYTKVSWIPDFQLFGMKKYTKDIIKLYTRYVLDSAMLTKVNIYFNEELIPVKSLSDYAMLYGSVDNEKLHIKTKDCEVFLTPSNEYQTISFVNGVYTRLGGQHVDAWSEALFRPIVDNFNGKNKTNKTPKVNINDVKQFFRLFVVAKVVRPEFDSQDKNKLESPEISAVVKKSHINTINKWSVIDKIEDIIRAKEMVVLKKAERVTKANKIDGYDRANKSGGKNSEDCSLFITEGLSAKTYVVAGIEKGIYNRKGRDWNGILPVRGKLLNVRDKTPTTIAGNKIICSIIQALGLKHGVDYKNDDNFKKLNYGKLVIVADADVDGIHIEGLIINFLHSLYHSLLERKNPFVISLKTPIARVKISKKNDMLFYDERHFHKWYDAQSKKLEVKYYKGLGTTKAEDVPDTFGEKLLEFDNDKNSFNSMQKAFHKKYSDDRKQWLAEYNPQVNNFSLDDQEQITTISITEFINEELIKFSHADCVRSIPSGIDGLKESQRKILYAVKKRKLKYSGKSLKVAQLAGYTAEHSNYHHGEKNLFDTIIGMANEFPGTNNIPLLYRDGMFGTRLEGGEDAADGRYIFTKMDIMTELIYREEDEGLLKQINDDGDLVQPEHYIPILPMILINGSSGIGTGWSSNIPCYNPKDIIKSIISWLDNEEELPELIPWYRNFKGDIEKNSPTRFITYGIVQETSNNSTVKVSELPIGMWTYKFSDFCEDLKADKKLKSVSNYSSPKNVNFMLKENDNFNANLETLKLHSYLYTSNMVVFDENQQICKYDNPQGILKEFCKIRLNYYIKRKQQQIELLKIEICFLKNKERFVKEVIEEKINIMNEKEENIINQLKESNYDKNPKKENSEEEDYEYLLRMQVRTFSQEKVNQLHKDINNLEEKLRQLLKTKEKNIWKKELKEFENVYDKWILEIDK